MQKGSTFQPSAKQVTDLKIVDYLVDIMPSPDMDYQEALIVAMRREKASFKLYNDLAAMAGTENLRALPPWPRKRPSTNCAWKPSTKKKYTPKTKPSGRRS